MLPIFSSAFSTAVKTIVLFAAAPFFIECSFGEGMPPVDRSCLTGIVDDSPLARSSDKTGWDYLFGILRNCSETDIEKTESLPAGFLELNRQPVEYRGRWVKITGKLLRCEFVPVRPDESPFDSGKFDTGKTAEIEGKSSEKEDVPPKTGFYQSWVVLPDRKDIPVCVCSLEIPDGVDSEGNDISLPVSITGIFYKRLLYLSESDEEIHTPAILAKTLKVLPVPLSEKLEKQQKRAKKNNTTLSSYFISTLGLLLAMWILLRTRSKKNGKKPETEIIIPSEISVKPNSKFDENKTVVNSSDDTLNLPPSRAKLWFIPLFILFSISGSSSQLYGADEDTVPAGKIDAEFVRTQLLLTDEYTWDALGDEKVPLEQQRDLVLTLLERLTRYVPAIFLKDNNTVNFPSSSENALPLSVLTADPAQYRGKVFRLIGTLVNAEIISLNPAEQKALEIPAIYRCRIKVNENNSKNNNENNIAEVLTAFAPYSLCGKKSTDDNTKERVAFTGIYIKRLYSESKDDSPLIPLLASPHLEWYPNNYLGSLGMDFGTLEQVPVLKISDLKKKPLENIPFPLSLLDRKELIRRAFKFTAADKEPFYSMLKAAAKTPAGRIEQEARKTIKEAGQSRTSAVSLFNRPAEMQGKPVLLTGTARRVLPVLTENEEVKKIYGIDKYYQIYLFTEDSQNNPLVICTASLPEGMPTGSAPDYNETISVGAFPYKLWVYESSEKLEGDEKHPESYKPAYAPMLIGRCPIWHSKPKDAAAKTKNKEFGSELPDEVKTGFTVVMFIALFGVWIFMRRLKSFKPDKTPEFKLRR